MCTVPMAEHIQTFYNCFKWGKMIHFHVNTEQVGNVQLDVSLFLHVFNEISDRSSSKWKMHVENKQWNEKGKEKMWESEKDWVEGKKFLKTPSLCLLLFLFWRKKCHHFACQNNLRYTFNIIYSMCLAQTNHPFNFANTI